MQVSILAFGIAKDILGSRALQMTIPEACDVGQLKQLLIDQYPEFAKLQSLALAVNQNYVQDSHPVSAKDEIVIIPPVSGG